MTRRMHFYIQNPHIQITNMHPSKQKLQNQKKKKKKKEFASYTTLNDSQTPMTLV